MYMIGMSLLGNSELNITGTFENCTSLEKVTIGDGVKEIQIDTFAGSGIKELKSFLIVLLHLEKELLTSVLHLRKLQ